MYADNTLTREEAARLCALGALVTAPMPYGVLAEAVRHFIDRVSGPTLDVMGASIELLIYEGLVVSQQDGEQAMLSMSEAGCAELKNLLSAHMKPGATGLNKLITALKFRYLHVLDAQGRMDQVDMLVDVVETELARLLDLREYHGDDTGYLPAWLDWEITQSEAQLVWLEHFRDILDHSDPIILFRD